MRGGMRVFSSTTSRDSYTNNASATNNLKIGCLCVTASDSKLWIYKGAKVWEERIFTPTHKHSQSVASEVWTISHLKKSKLFTYGFFKDNDEVLNPSKIRAVDVDTIEVTFPMAVTGKAAFVFVL